MGRPVCKSSRYDCALSKTLGTWDLGIGVNGSMFRIGPSAFYPRKCCRSPIFCGDRAHFTIKSAAGPYEPEVTIKSGSHFRSCPLSRCSRLIFRNRGICIWSTSLKAIHTGLTSGISHTERDQTTFRQRSDFPAFRSSRLSAPLI